MTVFNRHGPRLAIIAALAGVVAAACAADAGQAPGPDITLQAGKIVVLDFAVQGKSLVAVGERGVVLRSEDDGLHWSGIQAPTTRALTSVAFSGDKLGIAVGHGGTVLRTEDGGRHWQAVQVKEIGRDAVLGVTWLRSGAAVAWGAFGMFLVSNDQGRTWRRQATISADFDRHISKVIQTRDALMLVAETGIVARSKDQGQTWETLKTPYQGSYFGLLEMNSGALLIFGMRGNVYRSSDGGDTWEQMPFASKATLNAGSLAPDGRVVLAGNRGLIAISKDEGRSFDLLHTPEGSAVSQARIVDGHLVYTGLMATGQMNPK